MDDDTRIDDLKRALQERPDSDYARIQREDAEAAEITGRYLRKRALCGI